MKLKKKKTSYELEFETTTSRTITRNKGALTDCATGHSSSVRDQ